MYSASQTHWVGLFSSVVCKSVVLRYVLGGGALCMELLTKQVRLYLLLKIHSDLLLLSGHF